MPDITMCKGVHCQKRDSCYRFTATPSKYLQSYFAEPNVQEADGSCKYYLPEEQPTQERSGP